MQQRMSAWEPLLTPRRILFILFATGMIFFAFGLIILYVDRSIVECKVDYTDMTGGELMLKIDASTCSDTSITELTGDVFLYYELTNYFQNHRRFMKSRSDKQLEVGLIVQFTTRPSASFCQECGKLYSSASELRSLCDPRVEAADGRLLHPCGLSAAAVFTDEFSAVSADESTSILLDESRNAICLLSDLSLFKNPPSNEMQAAADLVDFWLYQDKYVRALHMHKEGVGWGVENSHFIVWMREAALPAFRKAYARFVTQPLKLPFYIKVSNNTYDVKSFGDLVALKQSNQLCIAGTKSVVVTQTSWLLGGQSSFLGIAYIVIGSICLISFIIFFYYHRHNPRHMGDVSWLKRALYT